MVIENKPSLFTNRETSPGQVHVPSSGTDMERFMLLNEHHSFSAVRLLAVFFLVLLWMGLPCAAQAKPVRVGFFPFEGYYSVDKTGLRSGYGYELLQLIGLHANFSYQYIDTVKTWAELEQMLEDGKIDLLTSVQKTARNEARFAFSDVPISLSSTILTVAAGNNTFVAGEYATYAGARVGMIRDNAHAQKFQKFAARNHLSCTLLYFENLESLQQALHSGNIDICVTGNLRTLHNEWLLEEFDPSPYYMMMSRDDSELIRQINDALKEMDVFSPNWRTELHNKFYSLTNESELQLSAAERTTIAEHTGQTFLAAVNPDNAPYSYFQNGQACGIIPELFSKIAQRAGIHYRVVETPDRAGYQALLTKGTIDFVMDAGWHASAAENMGYKLTMPYLRLPIAQLTQYNIPPEKQTSVAVPEGPIPSHLHNMPLFRSAAFTITDSVSDAVQAITTGTSTMVILYAAVAQHWMQEHIGTPLRLSLIPGAGIDIKIAVRTDLDYHLLSIINKSSESIQDEDVQESIWQHTNNMPMLTFLDYLYLHPLWGLAIGIGTCLFIGLFLIVLYQHLLSSRQKRLVRKLQHAKLEADKANEAKSSFLASMSHDLRTPLNCIIGFTDIALREKDPIRQREYIEKVKTSGELLAELVNDTLELSRVESGKMTLCPETINEADLYGSVVLSSRSAANLKGVQFNVEPMEIPAETVQVDSLKVQKILLNLLSNAIKYTPAGGTVSLSIQKIDPPVRGCTRRITVRDTGIGMGRTFQQDVYEPFAQENRPEAGNVSGTGLGLTIVKHIVELMNGTITFSSEQGKGTTFVVELPVLPVGETALPAREPEAPHFEHLAGKRILLCEDNLLNTQIATLQLKEHGMLVESTINGQEGLERFQQSAPGYYYAILMDIRMPIMNGYEATRAIRNLKRSDAATIPIIALSADAFEENRGMAHAAGINEYLTKPLQPKKLLHTLLRYREPD